MKKSRETLGLPKEQTDSMSDWYLYMHVEVGWAETHSNEGIEFLKPPHLGVKKSTAGAFFRDGTEVRPECASGAGLIPLPGFELDQAGWLRLWSLELYLSPQVAYQLLSFQGQKPTFSSSPSSHQYCIPCMLRHPGKAVSPLVYVAVLLG